MFKMARSLTILIIPALILASCDTRGSVRPRVRELPSFTVEMTLVKNLDTGENLVEAIFERDGAAFSDGIITVGGVEVPPQGGGLYYEYSASFPLPSGANLIGFVSPEDDYSKEVTIIMPGIFSVTQISPRHNPNADAVFVEWSASSDAGSYILAVSTGSTDDGTIPLRKILTSTTINYWVPDTTFEDFFGDPVAGTYYVYLIAFNEGFGPYEGIEFQVPEGLPEKLIADPVGVLRFGTAAPIDSIVVPF